MGNLSLCLLVYDYYEILQVHPKADQDAIMAAYLWLRGRYDPTRLAGSLSSLSLSAVNDTLPYLIPAAVRS